MILQAKDILELVRPGQVLGLRQMNGDPVKVLEPGELEKLVEEQMVCAKTRGRKIRWIELLVPLGAARRALGDNKSSLLTQASQTVERITVSHRDRARVRVFSHHPRCFRWRREVSRG